MTLVVINLSNVFILILSLICLFNNFKSKVFPLLIAEDGRTDVGEIEDIVFFFFLSVAFFGELFGDVFCSQADFTCSKFSRVCLRRFFRLDSLSSKPNINPR